MDQAHHQTQYTYDQNGNRNQITDANGNTTTYTYDALNRLTQTSQPFIPSTPTTLAHPVVSQTVYDANGNVVQSFSPRAVDCTKVSACEPSGTNNYVTTNHYDQLNRLTRVDLPINSTDGIATDATQYFLHRAYDFNGNLLSVSLPTTQSDPTQLKTQPGLLTVNAYFDPGWIASTQVGTNTLIHYDYNGKGQQTCRRPTSACGSDTTNAVFWSYRPDGRLLSRTDQQGQPVNYFYDADGNLTSSHDASGITEASQTPIDTQNSYDDLDRLVRSDLKPENSGSVNVPNWTFSSFAYDLNGNVTDQNQNGLEQSGSNGLPNGVVVKDGHKLHSDYDQANWLTDQIDSTLNQQVLNSFTPIGLESSREIDQSNGSGGFNLKQKTSWSYFPNGKLSTLTTSVPSQTPCTTPCTSTQTIESHTVSYLDTNPNFAGTSGVYVDGNRTQDQYSLRLGGGASSPCTTTSLCTASYGYDPRDRLVQNKDGHGDQTNYTLHGAGNIQKQVQTTATGTTTVSNTYDPNNLNQLQQSATSGGPTLLYWYDSLGRQQCVTDTTGSRADCNPSENTPGNKPLLQDYKYDYLDRLQTYRTYPGGGNATDEANYVYDALNRLVQETEQHPSFPSDKHITQFSYLGLGGLETEEQQTSKNSGNTLFIKDFTYDVYGHRLAMTVSGSTLPAVPNGTFTYGYDVHSSVSQLVDANGNTTASYGYTPYGQSDSQLSQGENPDKTNPINPFRYSAKRVDTGSGTVDMGVRRFGPDTAHFLTPDLFFGSLSDLSLSIDPLTDNRYDLAGGNPISFKEWDGHLALMDGGGAATTPGVQGAAGIFSSVTPTPVRDSQDGSGRVQNPCGIDFFGFQVSKPGCRPPTPQRSQTDQTGQQPQKPPLCQGLAAVGFGIGSTLCSAIAVPLPQPKTSAPSGNAGAIAAAVVALAAAADIGLTLLGRKNIPGKGPGIPGQGPSDPGRPTEWDPGRYQDQLQGGRPTQ